MGFLSSLPLVQVLACFSVFDQMTPIDKNIPIPAKTGGFAAKYPYHELEIGDSFLVPEITRAAISLSGVLNYRLKPKHFISRKVEGGVRVWRDK